MIPNPVQSKTILIRTNFIWKGRKKRLFISDTTTRPINYLSMGYSTEDLITWTRPLGCCCAFLLPLFLEWGTAALLHLDREPSLLNVDACVSALSVFVTSEWLGLLDDNCWGIPEHSSDVLARSCVWGTRFFWEPSNAELTHGGNCDTINPFWCDKFGVVWLLKCSTHDSR